MTLSREENARRHRDAMKAITEGMGLKDLGTLWGMSRVAVHSWCGRHLQPHECSALAHNGRQAAVEAMREARGNIEARIVELNKEDSTLGFKEISGLIGCSAVRVWQVFQARGLERTKAPQSPPRMPEPVLKLAPIRKPKNEHCHHIFSNGERCYAPTEDGKHACSACLNLETPLKAPRYNIIKF